MAVLRVGRVAASHPRCVGTFKDQPIVCVCRSGNRSAQACGLLATQGFVRLSTIQDGMNAWKQAGYPYE